LCQYPFTQRNLSNRHLCLTLSQFLHYLHVQSTVRQDPNLQNSHILQIVQSSALWGHFANRKCSEKLVLTSCKISTDGLFANHHQTLKAIAEVFLNILANFFLNISRFLSQLSSTLKIRNKIINRALLMSWALLGSILDDTESYYLNTLAK
jgi:hypothetical protein